MKFNCLLLLLSAWLLTHTAHSQSYTAVDWGTYFNDTINYPGYDYTMDDLVDQILVDKKNPESIYVVSQTKAPPKVDIALCSNEVMDLGGGDGYVAKYNRCGELIWSVYAGDFIQCIALDEENGNTVFYVCGKKGYVVNPPTAVACDGNAAPIFQTGPADKDDAFIAKYIDNGTSATLLRWTYFGGNQPNSNKPAIDNILGIDINKHKLFVVGNTKSPNLATGAVHVGDYTYNGNGDSFFAEFDSLLSTMLFFTYIGGAENDRSHDIRIYDNGVDPIDVFISGTTDSPTGIASGNGFDLTYDDGTDAFLTKWEDNDQDGVFTKTWGTYVGGSLYDHGRQLAIDQRGNAFLAIWGQSDNLPVTAKAYDKDFGEPGQESDGSDAGIFKINNNGNLMWCTYFGGKRDDMVNGLVIFRKKLKQFVVISGLTKTPGTEFPLTDPIQNQLNGDNTTDHYDAYVAVLNDPSTAQQKLMYSTYLGGSNEEGQKTGASYHPVIALGPANELYLSVATNSNDINSVVGSNFQKLVSGYSGGSDAFIAKLINENDSKQFNCPDLKVRNEVKPQSMPVGLSLLVYPNPMQTTANVSFQVPFAQQVTLEIYNSFGSLLQRFHVSAHAGTNTFSFEPEDFPAGIYIFNLHTADQIVTQILTKAN